MARVISHGLMAASIKVTILMTRSKVMVCSYGPMVASTTASGSMENSTVKVSISLLRVRPSVVNGKKERELDGFLSE